VTTFEDVHALTNLKSAYCRFLDTKDFAAMCALMTDDVTVTYGGGAITLTGREAVEAYMVEALGDPQILTSHLVSCPELEVDGDTATGRWGLVDTVIIEKANLVIRGASTYDDTYVRTPAGWRIQHTGYKRLFEEMGPRVDGTKTTAAYVGTDGRSSLV
jgi:ketosteroid isomerase-like protein